MIYRFRQSAQAGMKHVEGSNTDPLASAPMTNLPARLASPTAVMVRVGAVVVAVFSLVVF